MIRYGAIENLVWFWLIPALALLLVYGIGKRRRALAAFIGADSHNRAGGEISLLRTGFKAVSVAFAAGLIVFALAQPQWGRQWIHTRASGRDIIVALDVSRSMLADDVVPSRLERAKADIRDLVAAIEESGGHRVGLIAFAGSASLKCPLTQVTSHFKLVLDSLDHRSIVPGGTMIGDCIRVAIEAFDDKTQNFRDLILITDGEDMDSFPIEAAAAAREAGVTVYSIGLGDTAQGSRIPIIDRAGQRSYVEHEGEIVWSKLDEGVLRQVAQITGGVYVPAGTRAIELDEIFREVMEPKARREMDEVRRERYFHRYQWFLAPALLLLTVERLIRDTRRTPRTSRRSITQANDKMASAPRQRRSLLTAGLIVMTFTLLGGGARAEDAGFLIRQGNRLYGEGKFAEAQSYYERAAGLAPDSHIPLFNRAAALYQAGDYAAAAKLYEQSRHRAPESLRPYINYALGNSHLQQAMQSNTDPNVAAAQAKDAVRYYRDALSSAATEPKSSSLTESARYNIELAKRLIHQLEQQPPAGNQDQRERGQGSDKEEQGQPQSEQEKGKQDKGTEPDQNQPQSGSDQQPSATNSGNDKPRAQESDAILADQLSEEEAEERLRAAIARAQTARARRLTEKQNAVKGRTVLRDW